MTIGGVRAELRWGYYCAGTVGTWTVTTIDGRLELTAVVTDGDTFRLSQRPLTFVAPHAKGAWRWPVTELQMTGGALHAHLGPMET
jgi:hypothetical protein